MPILFKAVNHISPLTGALRDLSFIHFARWSIIRDLPANGSLAHRRLSYPHLFFESNFNGGWDEYIDAFSDWLARGMWSFWGSSYGFPGAQPTGPFKQYIKQNEYEATHFYSAYPEASTTEIRRALVLARHKPGTKQASAFMAMLPIDPKHRAELQIYLQSMNPSPFAALPQTHLARFVIVDDFLHDPSYSPTDDDYLDVSYLIFTSNFDDDRDKYLSELCDQDHIKNILSFCVGDTSSCANYLLHNEVNAGVFFSAYPDATVDQVKTALKLLPEVHEPEWKSKTPAVRIHVARVVAIVTDTYEREYVPGTLARRDQHSREHGTIKGTLTVDPEPFLKAGLTAVSGAEYPVIARLSPNSPDVLPWGRDAHGLALKVRLNDHVQDLIGTNTERFFAKDAEACVELVKIRAARGAKMAWQFMHHFIIGRRWRELRNLLHDVTQRVTNPLEIDYYSGVPIHWGESYVKWRLAPAPTNAVLGKLTHVDDGDLADAMAATLKHGEASFDLLLQLQQPGDPINDPTRRWTGPWQKVGRVRFPAQSIMSGEGLVFNLGNCLPEHQPGGEVAEVRVSVYEAISRLRLRKNQDRTRR
jgi:hypothetical protein